MVGRRVVVFAFGTRGDVLPLAVVAAALSRTHNELTVTFISHEAHRNLATHLMRSRVSFRAVSTPPVVPGRRIDDMAIDEKSEGSSVDEAKAAVDHRLREECIAAMDEVMGVSTHGVVLINLFALEGWHLAELYRLPCAVMSPYVVPYSAPSSFERRFRATHPFLYRRLKEAAPGEVGWGEVMHWMWPLFTDRWATWRSQKLHLSACPLTDPVTELPIVYDWPRATPLLYGFSRQVVECPAYWPASIHVCGFWYAPIEWEVSHADLQFATSKVNLKKVYNSTCLTEAVDPVAENVHTQHPHDEIPPKDLLSVKKSSGVQESIEGCLPDSLNELHSLVLDNEYTDLQDVCTQPVVDIGSEPDYQVSVAVNPAVRLNPKLSIVRSNEYNYVPSIKLCDFLVNDNNTGKGDVYQNRMFFVGFSSMGSMGFLERLDCMLKVLEAVLEVTCSRAILLTAGYPALDLAVTKIWEKTSTQNTAMESKTGGLREGLCLYDNRLFCYSGSVPYAWLLPQCSVAVHHGGSGTTAACLKSGIPQVICPFVMDQFYWAERMEWLGVAPAPLRPEHLMPDLHEDGSVRVSDAARVVTSAVMKGFTEECKQCASSLRTKIQEEDGIATAVRIFTAEFCL